MIAELLEIGAQNAKTSRRIEQETGLEKRSIQLIVEKERDAGAFICANQNGYFLAANREEVIDFYKRYTAGAKKMLHTARHFKKAAEQVEGQITL